MNKFAPLFKPNMSSPGLQYSKFPVVLVHLLFWAAFLFLPLVLFETFDERMRFVRHWGYQLILTALFFYLNYHVLIPKLLIKKKMRYYSLALIGVLLSMIGLTVLLALLFEQSGFQAHCWGLNWHTVLIPVFPFVLGFAISIFIKMTNQWLMSERDKKILENEKLTAELGFLKSQVHPHFLFNTLNNICSLARKKSEKTETALIKLSEFMRYMMDESKEDKVSLSKEIEYLQNYIELQRLRFTEGVKIDFKVMGDPTPVLLEPMLLIPFVENAFKHGIGIQEESEIWIDLIVTRDKLIFTVRNQIHPYLGENLPDEHGIGLRNVKRRLELLYPDSHDLTITDDNNIYKVILEIRRK